MTIKIIKKGVGKQNHRAYIVIEMSGDTKAKEIVQRFAKNYSAGFGSDFKEERNGVKYYHLVLWKRENPLSNEELKELLNNGYKQSFYL